MILRARGNTKFVSAFRGSLCRYSAWWKAERYSLQPSTVGSIYQAAQRSSLIKPTLAVPGLQKHLRGLNGFLCAYSTSSEIQDAVTPEDDETKSDPEQQSSDMPSRSTISSTSAVLSTVREYRQKYPNCVLLVRVGDFYELYFEQADEVGGDILGLQVVDKKFRSGAVRFTGFPARALLRYIELLVYRHGLSIALCEQFQEPMRRTFTRKVTRVITPGTLIDDQCIADTRVHNYILSIARLDKRQMKYQKRLDEWQRNKSILEDAHKMDVARAIADARREWGALGNSLSEFNDADVCLPDAFEAPPMPLISEIPDGENESVAGTSADADIELSLAWLDLATGDFMTCPSSRSMLGTDIARIRPKEVLVDSSSMAVQLLLASIYPPSQAASHPTITKVPTDTFHHWHRSRAESQETEADESKNTLEARSEKTSQNAAAGSSKPGGFNANVAWSISAPPRQLIALPERLLFEATELSRGEHAAASALLNYILDTQLGLLPPLQPPKRYKVESHVRMSAPTIQALELLRPLMGDHADAGRSLRSEIDHTRTSAGGRLLAKRLVAPSADLDIIEERLDFVEFFGANPRVRDQIYEHLTNIGDVERAVNKLSLNCGGPHDLLDIARTLQVVSKIKVVLNDYLKKPVSSALKKTKRSNVARNRRSGALQSHRAESELRNVVCAKEAALQSLDGLAKDIASKIRSDAPRDLKEFGFLQPNCSKEIRSLHRQLDTKDEERRQLQEKWRQQYGCNTLKLDTIPALGHFIEVSKREAARMADAHSDFRMIQSLKSKVRFENSEWTYLLSEIEMLRNRLQAEEMRVFEELRNSALASSLAIRTNSKVLAEIDVAISSALHASTRQYVRPRFVSFEPGSKNKRHIILNGRHPAVESQLLESSRQYVGNDCAFDSSDSRVLLLTGPNMGGKSTYLRQIALTSILAQLGNFVPADDAQLQIVDAIYSRIGAHDNLALDQSTFMIEMSETADILKHATPDSLVILDEIGRGTSTSDGIAIAYATLKYLHDEVRCKAVFATHYHELVPHVVPGLDALSPLHTAVYEDGKGGFSFLHKVRPGICTDSHALYVAQIAGIPKKVLKMARDFAASKP
ncbi:MutS protein 1 [Coemansia sp. RSA 1813]|nr:MutS protein 1 [Coemansia sp. RSA 1646]KAJ1771198.1 MutS protein 1 [Coemansia sp. RSA 1843]KAJ2089065.1 MutS protein 1 [Coemansia sp. RSA 986]KAJ2212027.1 MutS protein 1 [Coemansia sp. RSA 487]KAJ2566044.1 MutS protein 1 [Coemansia sp. RSA 1813]